MHYYAWNLSRGKTNDWVKGKGDAVNFDASDWYELLQQGDVMESLIKGHWQVMGEFDHEHHIKLVVDEWGPWYRDGSGLTPTNQLEQLPTLRDAVFSGLTLDTFNRHPEKVEIGCCAQLINCLNSLYLAHEDKFCVTPVGHTFALYGDHQGGQGLRTEFSSPTIHYDRDGKQASFWGLNGSASLHNREIVLTAVNPSLKDSVDAQIAIRGARVNSGSAVVLTAPDIHARNTFEQRQAIAPRSAKVQIKDGTLVFNFPAASVAKLNLQLA